MSELRIEDVDSENIQKASIFDLSSLWRRASQLYFKYSMLEKSDGFVSIEWSMLKVKVDTLIEEYKRRSLFVPKMFFKSDQWGLCKPHWRLFTIEDLTKTPGFKDADKVFVDTKFDGVRVKVMVEDHARIITDPEDTQTPNKSSRLPVIISELGAIDIPPGTYLDGELILIRNNECLHRTAASALINSKFNPAEPTKLAHLYIFDIIKYNNEDTKSYPQKERYEMLSKFKDTEHIHFVHPSIFLAKPSLSYYINISDAQKTYDKILSQSKSGKSFPKFISEGAMFKLPEGNYKTPENNFWAKIKERFEVSAIVLDTKAITRDGKTTSSFNYKLGIGPITEEYANAIKSVDKSFVMEFDNEWYNIIGWSDNTDQKVSIGDILRVKSEDINRFETNDPKYQYYGAYVSIVMQPVPEQKHPDTIYVLERLSELTPSRTTFVKSIESDVKESIANGSIPKDIYDKYAKPCEPLPREFYTDYREGSGWVQTHIRGITDDEISDYESKKRTLSDILVSHSVHLDIRLNLGLPTLIQFVITDNTVKDLIDYMVGTRTRDKSGKLNVHHSMMVVKPSSEEPQKIGKSDEMAIDEEGSKLLAGIQNIKGSYIIPTGDIGATSLKSAWMGLIWTGKVKSGTQRKDFHEFFFYPDEGNLFNGRMIFKALKDSGTARWESWFAMSDQLPSDPILHKDSGYYYPVKAELLTKLGRGNYKYGVKD